MKKKMYTTVALLMAVATTLIYSLIETNSQDMKSISDFLRHEVEENKTPSIQYAFFNVDSSIYDFAHGYRHVESKTAIDPTTTTYNLFSVTKTFTALAVLQLVQDGKIRLNHPVSYYLPEFPYNKQITVQQLLNHTSGIPNPLPLRWIHLYSEHTQFNRNEFFGEIFHEHPDLDFYPGTKFKYSNLGYVVLGQLIEKVSGTSYEQYVEEHIIKKIDLTPSVLGFEIDPKVQATGYHKWWSFGNALFGLVIDKEKYMGPREEKWKPFYHFYTNGTAYGGMNGTGPALIKYAQSLLKNDSVLLSETYKQILFTESVLENKPTGMSLSWYTGTLKGHQYYTHAGGGGGYYVELRVYPELKVGSVILFNRSGMTDERILDKADSFFITERR